MPDFSSCYFCGAALDEPLSESPVVPRTLQPAPDQQRTVVLCDGCRRKLGAVIDVVLDAVEDPETVQGDLSAGVGGGGVSEQDEEAPPNAGGDGGTDTAAADDEAGPNDGGDAGTDPAAADAGEPAPEVHGDRDVEPAAAEAGSEADDEEPGATAAEPGERSPGDPEPDLTALEYTKVMRLLENRELPVDRAEIRVVATNAYEIRPTEFDAVVDAAIERGKIVEEEGRFVAIE